MERLALKFNFEGRCCAILADCFLPEELPRHQHLLPKDRKLFFLIWVVWTRRYDTRIEKNERLSCPLRGCRKPFSKPKQLLDHVYRCPLLADGVYWCSDCRCNENFLYGIPTGLPRKGVYNPLKKSSRPLRLASIKEARRDILKCAARVFVGLGSLGLSLIVEYFYNRRARSQYLSRAELEREDIDYLLGCGISCSELPSKASLPNGEKLSCSLPWTCTQELYPTTKTSAEESPPEESFLRLHPDELAEPVCWRSIFILPAVVYKQSSLPALKKELHQWPRDSSVNCQSMSLLSSAFGSAHTGRSLTTFNELDFALAPLARTEESTSSSSTLIGSLPSVDQKFEYDNRESFFSPGGYSALPTSSHDTSAVTRDNMLLVENSANNVIEATLEASSSPALAANPIRYSTVEAATAVLENFEPRKSCSIVPLGPEMLHCLLPDCSFSCFDVATLDSHYKIPHVSDTDAPPFLSSTSNVAPKPDLTTSTAFEHMTDQNLLEDICKHLSNYYNQTLQKTRYSSIPRARLFEDEYPSPRILLCQGLGALYRVMYNVLPTTFSEVFALIHLSYAAAMIHYPQGLTEHSAEMLASVLNWSQAIDNIQDRCDFETISRQIWSPWCLNISQPSEPHPLAPVADRTSNATAFPDVAHSSLSYSSNHTIQAQNTPYRQGFLAEKSILLDQLRQGMVVEMCIHSLNIFEYSEFSKKQSRRQFQWHADASWTATSTPDFLGVVREKITRPLIKHHGLQNFKQCVAIAEMCVDRGALINLRELEIKLIHDGRLLCQPKLLYRRFLRTIRELCDAAVGSFGLGSNFRDEYLRDDIDKIREIIRGLDHPHLFTVSPSESRSSSLGRTDSTLSHKLETIAEDLLGDSNTIMVEPHHYNKMGPKWTSSSLKQSVSRDVGQTLVENASGRNLPLEIANNYSERWEPDFFGCLGLSAMEIDPPSFTEAGENRCSSSIFGAEDSHSLFPIFNDRKPQTKSSLIRHSRPPRLSLNSGVIVPEPSTISPIETSTSIKISPTDSIFTLTSVSTPATTVSAFPSPAFPSPNLPSPAFPSPTFPADNAFPSSCSFLEEVPISNRASTQSDSGLHLTTCRSCGTEFHGRNSKTNLRRHVRTIHTKQWVSCPHKGCDRVFTRAEYLRDHQSKSHPRTAF